MPKLTNISGRAAVKAFLKFGYTHVHTSGDHAILQKEGSPSLSIPLHKEVAQFLLKSQIKKANIKIIKLSRNFGAVSASKVGFKHVTGDCFLNLAADLQDPPELILDMLDHWQEGHKFVVCQRANRKDPLVSRIFSSFYYFFIRRLVDKHYPRRGFDMALMDKCMLPFMANSGKNIYTPLYAYWLGFKPIYINYNRDEREHGKSKWTFMKKVGAFLDAFLSFSVIPIRLVSLFGLFVSSCSFIYGFDLIIQYFLGRIPIQGFTTIVALMSFLLGLIILNLGMILEYVWRVYNQVNQTPEVVIDEML